MRCKVGQRPGSKNVSNDWAVFWRERSYGKASAAQNGKAVQWTICHWSLFKGDPRSFLNCFFQFLYLSPGQPLCNMLSEMLTSLIHLHWPLIDLSGGELGRFDLNFNRVLWAKKSMWIRFSFQGVIDLAVDRWFFCFSGFSIKIRQLSFFWFGFVKYKKSSNNYVLWQYKMVFYDILYECLIWIFLSTLLCINYRVNTFLETLFAVSCALLGQCS